MLLRVQESAASDVEMIFGEGNQGFDLSIFIGKNKTKTQGKENFTTNLLRNFIFYNSNLFLYEN